MIKGVGAAWCHILGLLFAETVAPLAEWGRAGMGKKGWQGKLATPLGCAMPVTSKKERRWGRGGKEPGWKMARDKWKPRGEE